MGERKTEWAGRHGERGSGEARREIGSGERESEGAGRGSAHLAVLDGREAVGPRYGPDRA